MRHEMTPIKRRRPDSTSSLSKPFKSPLRRLPSTAGAGGAAEAAPHTPTKHEEHPPSTTTPDTIINTPHTTTTTTPTPASKRKRTPVLPADPTLLHLQKEQHRLQARLASLRGDLDTAQQALRLESSTQDTELEALVAKWRGVAQSAAEEVFEGARERVMRMGGMKSWRERMREGRMGGWGNDQELEGGGLCAGDEGEEENRTRDEDDGEEEFTMDVMLKTLNVDLRAIGFDQGLQRFVTD